MRRSWIVALVGVALVAAAVFWFVRDQKRKIPPEPVSLPRITKQIQAKPVPVEKRASCTPLPTGGFSCGACRDASDCPKGSGCIINLATGRTECQGSDCKTDQDCERGTFCRVIGRTPRDEPMRACVAAGTRPSGAACDTSNGSDPSVSCGSNLMCVNGGCAPSCVPPAEAEDPPGCPGLLPCVQTEAGWGCTPSCKQGEPCGGGKTCSFLSVENPTSLCTYADGANCLGSKGGCAPNADCIVETNAQAERTTFRCFDRCTAGGEATCPTGSVCVPGPPTLRGAKTAHCRRGCAPGNDGQCGNGLRCTKAPGPSELWFCSAT